MRDNNFIEISVSFNHFLLLYDELFNVDWSTLKGCEDVDEACNFFYKMLFRECSAEFDRTVVSFRLNILICSQKICCKLISNSKVKSRMELI